jgi:class 3 adenylate cyclase
VLVTQVVRDLCRGKGIEFQELGEVMLKGFLEPERLFAVIGRRGS